MKRRLTVNVALYRELWQVDQQLKLRDLLDSAYLVPTVRDIYSLNIVAIPRNELLEGFELVRAVNAGSLLKWSDLRKQPAVRRNRWSMYSRRLAGSPSACGAGVWKMV